MTNSDQEYQDNNDEVHIFEIKNGYDDLYTLQEKIVDSYTFLEGNFKNQREDHENLNIEDLYKHIISMSNEKYKLEIEKGELTTILLNDKK